MEKINISVVNVVGDVFCTEAADGQKVFDLIDKALKENKAVNLSFVNVKMLTTAFLNTAVGQLYKDYSEERIKSSLSVEQLTPSGSVSLKRVVDTAKLYYKNPGAMEQSINDILGE
jgi:hypothetical protein